MQETKRKRANYGKSENAGKRKECESGLYVEASGIRKREKGDSVLSRKDISDI